MQNEKINQELSQEINQDINQERTQEITREMTKYLTEIYGADATFREGQLEALVNTLTNKFTLLVQKTGWGKSLIYFFATKFLRARGFAPTIIVSPLVSLMHNQVIAAKRCGLTCAVINGDTIKDAEWNNRIKHDEVDIIYITPEQLNKKAIKDSIISSIKKEMALFVVDEAHCISEWGHDFRPAFLEIKKYIDQNLMRDKRIHFLATTATANDAVIEDLKHQFGGDLKVYRGPLIRNSLTIDVLPELSMSERYAWIAQYIKSQNGAGIVYCLTIKHCNHLAGYLRKLGINAYAYSSKSSNREELEQGFLENKIQVLVATTALGMGYDKPDIAFVIHLQKPKSMLEYYQQIGRAGRSIPEAKAILMSGKEDEKLANYFIEHSAPEPMLMRYVLNTIANYNEIKKSALLGLFNIKATELDFILKHLEARGLIVKSSSAYSRTLKQDDIDNYIIDKEKINKIRLRDKEVMQNYGHYDGCYMEFISEQLNDAYGKKCGKCANCRGEQPNIALSKTYLDSSLEIINRPYMLDTESCMIEPRKKYPNSKNIDKSFWNNDGFFLTRYGIGLGELVANGKYVEPIGFDSRLVNEMAEMIKYLQKNQLIVGSNAVIAYVPSLRHKTLVRNFAVGLGSALNLPCVPILQKVKETEQQKTKQNSELQYRNIADAFGIDPNLVSKIKGKNVYLIDDMVDSKWTFTVCGMLLLAKAGALSVTPFALADTSVQEA